MTYSLFEFVKEKFEELIQDQPEDIVDLGDDDEDNLDAADDQVN